MKVSLSAISSKETLETGYEKFNILRVLILRAIDPSVSRAFAEQYANETIPGSKSELISPELRKFAELYIHEDIFSTDECAKLYMTLLELRRTQDIAHIYLYSEKNLFSDLLNLLYKCTMNNDSLCYSLNTSK